MSTFDACSNGDLGEFLLCYIIITNLGGKNDNFRLIFSAFSSVKVLKSWQRGYNYFALRGIRFRRKSIRPIFTQRGKTQICK